MRTSHFEKLVARLPHKAVLCGAPVAGGGTGGSGYSLPDIAAPTSGQWLLLGVALSLFVALGLLMFRRWGSAGSPAEATAEALDAAPVTAGQLSPAAASDEARDERELVSV